MKTTEQKLIDITNATPADIDLIMAKALIISRAEDFGAPIYNEKPLIDVELCAHGRLPCHPDYHTNPVWHTIRVHICGGMPLTQRARRRAHKAAREIQEIFETPIVFAGLTGTNPQGW